MYVGSAVAEMGTLFVLVSTNTACVAAQYKTLALRVARKYSLLKTHCQQC
jgi:uncharacterized protein (UPF0179 family)